MFRIIHLPGHLAAHAECKIAVSAGAGITVETCFKCYVVFAASECLMGDPHPAIGRANKIDLRSAKRRQIIITVDDSRMQQRSGQPAIGSTALFPILVDFDFIIGC